MAPGSGTISPAARFVMVGVGDVFATGPSDVLNPHLKIVSHAGSNVTRIGWQWCEALETVAGTFLGWDRFDGICKGTVESHWGCLVVCRI